MSNWQDERIRQTVADTGVPEFVGYVDQSEEPLEGLIVRAHSGLMGKWYPSVQVLLDLLGIENTGQTRDRLKALLAGREPPQGRSGQGETPLVAG